MCPNLVVVIDFANMTRVVRDPAALRVLKAASWTGHDVKRTFEQIINRVNLPNMQCYRLGLTQSRRMPISPFWKA